MAHSAITGIQVETQMLPPSLKSPATTKTLFLAGAGSIAGLDILGKCVKSEAIAVYLEDSAIESLAVKWKSKTAEEIEKYDFLRDVISGSFEKVTQVIMMLPLSGKEYSEKLVQVFVPRLKAANVYTIAVTKAVEEFLQVFQNQHFGPGSSIFFTHLTDGSLMINFSKDHSVSEVGKVMIKNKHLSDAILELNIKVSPEASKSMEVRVRCLALLGGGSGSKYHRRHSSSSSSNSSSSSSSGNCCKKQYK